MTTSVSECDMLRVSIAAARLGVCTKTIRRWDSRGLLRCLRTPGGHRRIPASEVERLLSGSLHYPATREQGRANMAVYARVSSHGQRASGDLERQVRELIAVSPDSPSLVLTDVGSGLNMRRRGLWQLVRAAERGDIDRVLVTRRDRLARFGTELIEYILSLHGVSVRVLHEDGARTPQEEVVSDLMAFIASFSGRVYGLRGALLRAARRPQGRESPTTRQSH
jgi:excisionase family DNA binding protein